MLKNFFDLLTGVITKKSAQLPPTISWKDILKEESKHLKKKNSSMLLPTDRVLVWSTDAESGKGKRRSQVGITFQFKFLYLDIVYDIKTQRPFETKVVSELIPKITHQIKRKVFKDQPDSSPRGLCINLDPRTKDLVTLQYTATDLMNDARITHFIVNESEFKITRNGNAVHSVTLPLTPLIGKYCLPSIKFNVKDMPYTLHWFLKNEKGDNRKTGDTRPEEKLCPTKADVDALNISFLDEDSRTFNLEGYTFVNSGNFFVAEEKDIGHLIAVVVDIGRDFPANVAISCRPISKGPEELITDEQVEWCHANKPDADLIRVMSYNILANQYLTLNADQEKLFFNYCPAKYQYCFWRTPIFLKQMHDFIQGNVSIFFLQEVDLNRYEFFIRPFLNTVGYSSEHSKKVKSVGEGVCTAFDQKRFKTEKSFSFTVAELVEVEEYNEDIRRMLKTSEETTSRFSSRPTILQVIILEDIINKNVIVCANTHLHHDPEEEQVKLLQALTCCRKVVEIYHERKRTVPENKISILFGGDFNSLPESAVYTLMNTAFLPKEHKVWNFDKKIVAEDVRINEKMDCLSGNPMYTNFTADSTKQGFVGVLDYIWGTEITAIRQCPMPTHEKVERHTGLPSIMSPSDHLPIITDIKL